LPFDPIAEARRQWNAHGWDDAAEGMAIVTSIVRVNQLLVGRVEAALRPLNLSFARYELLTLLLFSRTGMLPLGKIGARLQVQPGAVTNAVDRLEADELVLRKRHQTDGRTTLAAITPRGRKLARAASKELNESVFSRLGISPAGSRELFALLKRFRLDDFAD
jgi:DNA-binding MarR family transcriptional regulator